MTLLPEVRQELYETAERRAHTRWRRPRADRLIAVFGALVAVAVAAVAVIALGHRSTTPSPTSVPPSARQLVSMLAILRRPQTAADRALPVRAVAPTGWSLVPRLTRLAVTVPAGRSGPGRVYVVVFVPLGPQAGPNGLQLDPAGGAVAQEITVVGGRFFAAGPLVNASRLGRPDLPAGCRALSCAIVPDGVARAKWVFQRRGVPGASQTITIYPTVRDNITWSVFPPDLADLLSVTWYDADGHVISSLNLGPALARLQRQQQRALVRSDRRPIAPLLLAHFKLFRLPKTGGGPALPVSDAVGYANQQGYGLNVGQTRFVALGGTEPPVNGWPHGIWVIPGTNGLCFEDTQGAGGCANLTGPGSPDTGHFVMSSGGSGVEWITGVVPDPNHSVSVVLVDSRTQTVPVIDNAFSVEVRGHAVELITKNAAGQTTTMRLG